MRPNDPDRNTTEVCECNERKWSRAECCQTCKRRDAAGARGPQRLVMALRVMAGVATMDALVMEIGVCERQVYRDLAVCIRRGIVVVRVSGEEVFDLRQRAVGLRRANPRPSNKRGAVTSRKLAGAKDTNAMYILRSA